MVRRSVSLVAALTIASLLVGACATSPLPTATPRATPASVPTPSSTAIESPTPTDPPSPSSTPGPQAPPTPRPTQPYIFSTDEFAAAFRAGGLLRGKTVLVDGSVLEIGNGTFCSPPPPAFRCALDVLAGTSLQDHVYYERWATKENEGAHFEGGDITWPWWGGPDWPVEGLLVLRITDEGKIQFVGRQRRLVRSVADAKALDINSIDPEEVVLVEGWLTGFGGILDCLPPPPDTVAGLPERWCSNSGYLMDALGRNVSNDADRAAGIELQHNAYWDYAPGPQPELAQLGDGEPRFGTYALSPRLEGWCAQSAAPCWQWNLVGRLDEDPNLSPRERIDSYWLEFDDVSCMGMLAAQSIEEVAESSDLIIVGRPIGTEPWVDSPYETENTLIHFDVSEVIKGTLTSEGSSGIQLMSNSIPPGDLSDVEHVLLLTASNRDSLVFYPTEGYMSIYANVDGRVVTPEFAAVKQTYGNHLFSTGFDGTRFENLLERVREAAHSSAQQRVQGYQRALFAC